MSVRRDPRRAAAAGLPGRLLALVLVAAAAMSGCSGTSGDPKRRSEGPELTPWPAGLTAYVDQSRSLRQTRTAFVRLVNEPEREVTVTRAVVTSPRFGEVTWTGEKTFGNETDLDFAVPAGRCGNGSDAEVRLTYRIDGGPPQTSVSAATDRYGAIGLFLDRDCAQRTLAEAADLRLGTPRVVGGPGRDAVWELPVVLSPTGDRADVSFGGFEDTVLFRNAPGSASVASVPPVRLAPRRGAVRVLLRLVPGRCDPHALAEDKVGTLVGVRVLAPGLSEATSFHLPIGDERRRHLRAFFAVHCGL